MAVLSDSAAVVAIAGSVVGPLGQARGGALFLAREGGSFEGLPERFEQALDNEDQIAVVGTYEGLVFGYAIAHSERVAGAGKLGLLQDFVVEEPMRKVGIGEAMMNLLVDWFRAEGCFGVDAWALPGDRHTKNFFESFGLKARLLTAHLKL